LNQLRTPANPPKRGASTKLHVAWGPIVEGKESQKKRGRWTNPPLKA